jgi:hypothetical protein
MDKKERKEHEIFDYVVRNNGCTTSDIFQNVMHITENDILEMEETYGGRKRDCYEEESIYMVKRDEYPTRWRACT